MTMYERTLNIGTDNEKRKHLPRTSSTKVATNTTGVAEPGRGAIFTKREVAEFILDLAGYTADRPLHNYRLLEPSFGHGDFLLPAVKRLLKAYKNHNSGTYSIVHDLSAAIRAVEIHDDSIKLVRAKLEDILRLCGVSETDLRQLIETWIIKGDFLLVKLPHRFTHAVGNPPYVRQELIPGGLLAKYKRLYKTIYDRADLYVPFIERSLSELKPKGILAFICADRWMKNKYGRPLREMVASEYHLESYVDMVDTPAFQSEVSAYPAIMVIAKEKPGLTRIAHRPQINRHTLSLLAKNMVGNIVAKGSGVVEVAAVVKGGEPWILQSFDQLAVVRRLEADFPTLEEAGCKVGIGVATGADKVFIGPFDSLDVEHSRKLPLVKTKDIEGGAVEWQGFGVINPFLADGSLVNLKEYPKLSHYFEKNKDIIQNRNCAKKNKKGWYRTIDRIYPALAKKPKLLIPDIKGDALIVYEDGHYYPHHNLYHITSNEWDLMALQAVLRSGIARLFVSIYSTQMRGGYFRFQAQYLRRIRLPLWTDISGAVKKELMNAANKGDLEACNRAVFGLYRLTPEEREALGGNGVK